MCLQMLINGLLRSYRLYSPVYPLQFVARDQDCGTCGKMDDVRIMTREYRQYPEYSNFFSTRRADDRFEDRPQRESTQIKWGGQDGRREPDSGIGYTQDHRTRWTDDGWVEPDPFARIQYSRRVVNAEQEVGQP